jgi:glycosyltransferase involved in cell wall biosynthesis
LIVRNAFEHDSRVLRAAHTLQSLGFETTVLAVLSWTERRQLTDQDGIQVRRIGPSSRFAWFVYSQVSSLAPAARGPAVESSSPAGVEAEPDPPGLGPRSRRRLASSLRRLLRPPLRWASTLYYYRQGIAEVIRLRPDLIHCNDYNTVWIGLAGRVLCGSKVVYDSHELWPDRNLRPEPRWWLLLCERLFVRSVDRVITASPGYSEEMARRYGIPTPPSIHNVPELAAEPRRRGPGDGGDRVAIYVGGMLRNRGIEQSIRALEHADGVRLRLVGPAKPAFRAELDELVAGTGTGARVEFVAPVPSEQVVATLAAADAGLCLIQPACLSYRLTLPNKLFEYVLAGLPVLGSDFPVIGGFIERWGVGLTVDPTDPEAIGAALEAILEPEANARHRAAAAAAAEQIRWEDEREKLVRVYRETLPLPEAA